MSNVPLILASGNAHKIREFADMFPGHELIPASTFPGYVAPEETGTSFLENSLIKAEALYNHLNSPEVLKRCEQQYGGIPSVLADDSGIAVDALGGRPGIYSARFGQDETGRELSAAEQNTLLLSKLTGIPAGMGRSARYLCCMTLIVHRHRIFTAQESWEGEIALQPSGNTGGFGYDPIFFLPDRNCTVADLSAEEKNSLSHRSRAARIIVAVLNSLEFSLG